MRSYSNFILNGQKYGLLCKKTITILDLVKYLNYESSLIIIEVNKKIISEKIWNDVGLKNKDQIEIITIVGGG